MSLFRPLKLSLQTGYHAQAVERIGNLQRVADLSGQSQTFDETSLRLFMMPQHAVDVPDISK